MKSNSMRLSTLRGTSLLAKLSTKLRRHSVLISPTPFLRQGGSGTLATYMGLSGILAATHIMVNYLETKEIFVPIIGTEDPQFFLNDKVPIKRVIHLETIDGLKYLRDSESNWPEGTLDICFIEIDDKVFEHILQQSKKQAVDLLYFKKKYLADFDAYCCSNSDWCWVAEGFPRCGSTQDINNIISSPCDGSYICGGTCKTNLLIHVVSPYDVSADLCVHQLGPSEDLLPKTFAGLSGAGVWQVRFQGNNGIPERIDEIFFSGVMIAETKNSLWSRGPISLYDVFLRYLETILNKAATTTI